MNKYQPVKAHITPETLGRANQFRINRKGLTVTNEMLSKKPTVNHPHGG